jgi:TPP-dependent pyruvate/acetoin dehydrogenase alpha subunit
MITSHTPESLRAFEEQIAEDFNRGLIRAPVHLSGGGAEDLIRIFQKVQPQDWVVSNWRSHWHALLKGVSPEQMRRDIRDGRSITLCYPDHRVFTTAILGGQLSIALGIAMAIKRRQTSERVWCFCGDMTARTGAFAEVYQYASGHELPLSLIVENNNRSVKTDTTRAWGTSPKGLDVDGYMYEPEWPHSGTGKWVEF